VMSLCRSVLRIAAANCLSPATVLRRVNRMLNDDIAEDMFISLLYLVLDTTTRQLTVARAGHAGPILNPGSKGVPSVIEPRGMAIGFGDPDSFDLALEERAVTLAHGDMVVAYTDGVTEAMDQAQNEWGVLNLIKTVQVTALDDGGAQQAAKNVQQRLLQFVGDTPQYDDMTLVAFRLL